VAGSTSGQNRRGGRPGLDGMILSRLRLLRWTTLQLILPVVVLLSAGWGTTVVHFIGSWTFSLGVCLLESTLPWRSRVHSQGTLQAPTPGARYTAPPTEIFKIALKSVSWSAPGLDSWSCFAHPVRAPSAISWCSAPTPSPTRDSVPSCG